MNMSELHLFFILRNRAYIHMHEALDAKYREASKQRHLLKAQWYSLQFFPDFSNKAFFIAAVKYSSWEQETRSVLWPPAQFQILTHLLFAPVAKKLPYLHLQRHHMAGQATHVMLKKWLLLFGGKKVYQTIRTQLRENQSSGGSG